ncbi:MAG: CDP-diacylglycerol--glycerol-3-phosphate 3-phosphatidyltransferase [Candidatus Binataceae bacterium]|nr:CDP-diacylglycerol--glycerol-3-phosphate 3-phosphatidyltransferase [Candidatus Binataceae bacterium]
MAITTPNLLTLARIATAPFLIYLLCFTGPTASAVAALLFFCATISDYLDGYIARSYGSGSTLGKFLDPLADKIVVTAVLIMLAGMPRAPHVPAWMVAVLVIREIMVTGLRAVAASEGEIIAAGELGKYKMALQSIAVQGLLIHYTYFHVNFFAAGMFVLWIAMIVSIWSGLDYFIKARGVLRPKAPQQAVKRAAI